MLRLTRELWQSMALETITTRSTLPVDRRWVTSELVSIATMYSDLFTAVQLQHTWQVYTNNDRIQPIIGDPWTSGFCGVYVVIVGAGLSQN
jgi:hypothetical protein